eukprot:4316327-Ditylum_brightwellii.AAC.2
MPHQTFACDNIQAIYCMNLHQNIKETLSTFIQPDNDTQTVLNHILDSITGEIIIKHVKGHQDSQKPGIRNGKKKKLSWEAKLNIQADLLATLAKL